MSGIEFEDGDLVIRRDPNRLDTLALEFSELLHALDIDHVFVSEYVAILLGRSRANEHIDVLIEPIDTAEADTLVTALEAAGYWGPAMPLADRYEMLSNGDNIWVAPDDQVTPHLEVKFVSDAADRATIDKAITARIGDGTLPIGPLELQIAYKLFLGSQNNLEDAVHIYTLFEESLRDDRLQEWVTKLGVEDEYERLRTA